MRWDEREEDCICIIPAHWPRTEHWAHVEVCPWRVREIERLKRRWCS